MCIRPFWSTRKGAYTYYVIKGGVGGGQVIDNS